VAHLRRYACHPACGTCARPACCSAGRSSARTSPAARARPFWRRGTPIVAYRTSRTLNAAAHPRVDRAAARPARDPACRILHEIECSPGRTGCRTSANPESLQSVRPSLGEHQGQFHAHPTRSAGFLRSELLHRCPNLHKPVIVATAVAGSLTWNLHPAQRILGQQPRPVGAPFTRCPQQHGA